MPRNDQDNWDYTGGVNSQSNILKINISFIKIFFIIKHLFRDKTNDFDQI